MADNYLERQREVYEQRKAEWLKAQKAGTRRKAARRQGVSGQRLTDPPRRSGDTGEQG